MSRILTPAAEAATGPAADVFEQIRKVAGSVPNTFAAIGALNPTALKAVLNADGVLASGSLSKQDQETIKLIVSVVAGCDYCVAAHSLLGKLTGLKPDVLARIRAGEPTGDARRDALAHFVHTLVHTSGTIAETELSAIKQAGYTDAQLVDISLAIALTVFTNVFNRINDTAIDFPPVK
ncbi:carboxymuconolactone decarboxylase family protein [Dyella flava]|uniref:Carboxymuconolactone decarboxylase family protein n=1 Tax=Dyella flava TaxID=1920170 RepID=A0ABS2K220_9GAMM|nr:carboxymuconolactone decarboxylase family protein [Dyella flava]MBM7125295.1 carboxymuconolactone decarboxylase family protein [Dyella flava]GLQ50658.1 alkyl hydroperoxide reductase AhpD [Dyella flava]